jgi:hypothetical protein
MREFLHRTGSSGDVSIEYVTHVDRKKGEQQLDLQPRASFARFGRLHGGYGCEGVLPAVPAHHDACLSKPHTSH